MGHTFCSCSTCRILWDHCYLEWTPLQTMGHTICSCPTCRILWDRCYLEWTPLQTMGHTFCSCPTCRILWDHCYLEWTPLQMMGHTFCSCSTCRILWDHCYLYWTPLQTMGHTKRKRQQALNSPDRAVRFRVTSYKSGILWGVKMYLVIRPSKKKGSCSLFFLRNGSNCDYRILCKNDLRLCYSSRIHLFKKYSFLNTRTDG